MSFERWTMIKMKCKIVQKNVLTLTITLEINASPAWYDKSAINRDAAVCDPLHLRIYSINLFHLQKSCGAFRRYCYFLCAYALMRLR